MTVDAPDYTEGERRWQQSTLYIEDVQRSDDGLYECQAVNIGGKYFKSGHISVEFPPTFEDQVITKEWSWDQRSVNLSCLGMFEITKKLFCQTPKSKSQVESNSLAVRFLLHGVLKLQTQDATTT